MSWTETCCQAPTGFSEPQVGSSVLHPITATSRRRFMHAGWSELCARLCQMRHEGSVRHSLPPQRLSLPTVSLARSYYPSIAGKNGKEPLVRLG